MPSFDVTAPLVSEAPAFVLPNPLTPLAFIPPDNATQLMITNYVFVAVATIQIWDMVSHLVDDYYLIKMHRIKFPMIVYFISRLATSAYLLGNAIISTAPTGHCAFSKQLVTVFYVIAVPSSELLFFLHVRAVYMDNKAIVRFFMFMWIASVGGSVTPVIAAFTATRGINIGVTDYCTSPPVIPTYTEASAIIPAVNDTLLFFALAWGMQRYSYGDHGTIGNFKSFLLGDHLPRVSKSLFQNGQAYILSTMVMNITTIIMLHIDSLPLAYRTIMAFPCIMVMSIMAGRLYRNTKSGAINFPSRENFPSPSAVRLTGLSLPQANFNIGISISTVTDVSTFTDSKAIPVPSAVNQTLGEWKTV